MWESSDWSVPYLASYTQPYKLQLRRHVSVHTYPVIRQLIRTFFFCQEIQQEKKVRMRPVGRFKTARLLWGVFFFRRKRIKQGMHQRRKRLGRIKNERRSWILLVNLDYIRHVGYFVPGCISEYTVGWIHVQCDYASKARQAWKGERKEDSQLYFVFFRISWERLFSCQFVRGRKIFFSFFFFIFSFGFFMKQVDLSQ